MDKFIVAFVLLIFTFGFVSNTAAQKRIGLKSDDAKIGSFTYDNKSSEFYVYTQAKDRRTREYKIYVDIYDTNYEKIGRGKFPLKDNSEVVDVVSNKDHVAFQVINERREAVLFYVFNKKGERKAINFTTSIRNKALSEQIDDEILQPKIYPSETGFYIVYYFEREHEGYIVKKVNNNLETEWGKIFKPEKRGELIRFAGLQETNNKVNIINARTLDDDLNDFKLQYYLLDNEEGNTFFKLSLDDNRTFLYPNKVNILDDKSIILSGLYFKNNRYKSKFADGIFIKKLNNEGEIAYNTLVPMENIFNYSVNDVFVVGFIENRKLMHLIVEPNNENIELANFDKKTGEFVDSDIIVCENPTAIDREDSDIRNFSFVLDNSDELTFIENGKENPFLLINENKQSALVEVNNDGSSFKSVLSFELKKSRRSSKIKFTESGAVKLNDTKLLVYKFSRFDDLFYIDFQDIKNNNYKLTPEPKKVVKSKKKNNRNKENAKRALELEKRKAEIERIKKQKEIATKNNTTKQKETTKKAVRKSAEDYTDEELKEMSNEELERQIRILEFREKRLQKLLEIKEKQKDNK